MNTNELRKLPEETKDEVRDKINAYCGERSEIVFQLRKTELKHISLQQDKNEIEIIIMSLQIKLRDRIVGVLK